MREFIGHDASLEVVDRRTTGWGHINVDQIIQTDRKPVVDRKNALRELTVEKRFLHFPVKNGAPRKKIEVLRAGTAVRFFDIELADAEPDWWAFLNVTEWKGERLTIKVNTLREESQALELISDGDEIKGAEELYREPLRPQFHFSARRGWLNDPNGLVFFKGRYHLFFQHNPYGWSWGNMHWGHATSADLVHWEESSEALYPDEMGPMFSGSAVIDWKNTSGFGRNGEPPMVLLYTAAGNPTVQCLAYSTDGGRTFRKHAANPIVSQITEGNRDPKVIWHEATQRWVMVLYVGFDQNNAGKKTTRHTIHFLTSTNLKDWALRSVTEGFFECPDFFELPVEGNPSEKKWLLSGASSEYMLGSFDGDTFRPETAKLPGHRGKGFYAAQTFSDIPPADGRRIQFGWLQAPSAEMPFNQCMSLPLELKLLATSEGPRLAMTPVKELLALEDSRTMVKLSVDPGETKSLFKANPGPCKIVAEFEPGADSEVTVSVNGASIVYTAATQELLVNGRRSPAPLRSGKQRLMLFVDRTTTEIFASDGLAYIPLPLVMKPGVAGPITISLKGAPLKEQSIQSVSMRSAWKSQPVSRQ